MEKEGCSGDAVLTVDSDAEFSGFESDDIPPVGANVEINSVSQGKGSKSDRGKAPKNSKKPTKIKSSVKAKQSKKSKENQNLLSIENLSEAELEKLKHKLGISIPAQQQEQGHGSEYYNEQSVAEDYDYQQDYRSSRRPNIHVEIDNEDISDDENVAPRADLSKNLQHELFGEQYDDDNDDDDEWMLPKLKTVEKDKPIAKSLASLINTACTNQCVTDELIKKYRIPENCDKLSPPMVNTEIYKILDKRARTNDRYLMDIQNLVAASMVPVIKLAEILKPQISGNSEAKSLLSDTITLMGQTQLQLSLRRRYAIRPSLKKKYFNLCNLTMPVTSKLFGDDVTKEIKNCDNMYSLGREKYGPYESRSFRGKMPFRGAKRGRSFHPYGNTSQNYHPRGSYAGSAPQYRGFGRGRGKFAPATVSSTPNDN